MEDTSRRSAKKRGRRRNNAKQEASRGLPARASLAKTTTKFLLGDTKRKRSKPIVYHFKAFVMYQRDW